MLGPGDIIRLLGCRRGGRNREGSAALLDREALERRQIVRGEADDFGAGLLELGRRIAERVRLKRTALGERLGEEIEHNRALFELGFEVELEGLSAERAGGHEV